jgi:predicted nucleic acid-binding protein
MRKVAHPLVLIDTSAWIEFLRVSPSMPEANFAQSVQQCLERDQARFCSIVQAELLQGIKSAKEQARLDLLFAAVPLIDTLHADWINAGLATRELRAKGITVPLSDALIAAIAHRIGAQVLSPDQHFKYLIAS